MSNKKPQNENNEAIKEELKEEVEKEEQNCEADSCEGEVEDKANSKSQEESSEEQGQEPSREQEDADTRYIRLMADFQNYRKRVEKEKNDIYSFANEKIVSELLDVLDNFERALGTESYENIDENEGFVKGMNMIFKQLKDVLEKSGVKEIEALGIDFDPNFHNAVMMEDSEEYESGKVTAVLQKGYTLNNKVIRPSMVKVAN